MSTNMAASGSNKSFNDVINIRDFYNKWMSASNDMGVNRIDNDNFTEYAKETMAIPAETVQELEAVCRPSSLDCDGELSVKELMSNAPTGLSLHTTKYQHEHLKQRASESKINQSKFVTNLRYYSYNGPHEHEKAKMREDESTVMSLSDVILSVKVYRSKSGIKQKPVVQEMFDVLGDQFLTELRDRISCVADTVVQGEHAHNVDRGAVQCAKDIYKSGYFFIEGVFYNDMRHSDAKDYSRVVREWARDGDRGLGDLATAHMESVKFIDLSLRLGQPYVYVHQGDCEHTIVFNDIRLLHVDDCLDRALYPILTMKHKERVANCRMCQVFVTRWIVTGSSLTPDDPCFLCDTCFNMLHYDSLGNRTENNFQAYKYHVPDLRH